MTSVPSTPTTQPHQPLVYRSISEAGSSSSANRSKGTGRPRGRPRKNPAVALPAASRNQRWYEPLLCFKTVEQHYYNFLDLASGHGLKESQTVKRLIRVTRKMTTMMTITALTRIPCLKDLRRLRMVEISLQLLPIKRLFSLMPSSLTSIKKLAAITPLFKFKSTYLRKLLRVRAIQWAMANRVKRRFTPRTTPTTTTTITTHNQHSRFPHFFLFSICPYRWYYHNPSVSTEPSLSIHHGSPAPLKIPSSPTYAAQLKQCCFFVCSFFLDGNFSIFQDLILYSVLWNKCAHGMITDVFRFYCEILPRTKPWLFV